MIIIIELNIRVLALSEIGGQHYIPPFSHVPQFAHQVLFLFLTISSWLIHSYVLPQLDTQLGVFNTFELWLKLQQLMLNV